MVKGIRNGKKRNYRTVDEKVAKPAPAALCLCHLGGRWEQAPVLRIVFDP